VARAHLAMHADALTLHLRSPGAISCWLDGHRATLVDRDDDEVLELPGGPAQEVVVLLYFASPGEARSCHAVLRGP
jgi:hypothetical protein